MVTTNEQYVHEAYKTRLHSAYDIVQFHDNN